MTITPVDPWVVRVDPSAAPAAEGAVDVRLVDQQVRVDDAGLHRFTHFVVRVLNEQGLSAGNLAVAWQPEFGAARVHKVAIIRDGKTIDAMGNGSAFQVIRREANLGNLQVDGVLTAIMTVADLRVGDELEFSFTVDSKNPVLANRSEDISIFTKGPVIGRFYQRFAWPRTRNVTIRVGSKLPQPVKEPGNGDTAYVIDRKGFRTPGLADSAPTRFAADTQVSLSEFATWADVAETIRPLYDAASKTAPTSLISAEAARIAALSADPKVRASEALTTVQRQVRYFARVDGLGGYKPEDADAVWQARVGDCKGKAALLIALLRALGIEAVPAFVSSKLGDGLDQFLPMPARFDHVIVRASIGGKVYWLDGTRSGDGAIDTIPVPDFVWALPVLPNPRLERLETTPSPVPDYDWRLDLDARAGKNMPAKATATAVLHGDAAETWRMIDNLSSRADRDTALRKLWGERHDWITISAVTYAYDATKGEVRLGMTGTGKMEWLRDDRNGGLRYEANKARLGVNIAPKREDDERDIPVAIDSRYYVTRQTILLPDGGKGYMVEGDPISSDAGGLRYSRTARIVDGRFEMTTSTQSGRGEISYAAAKLADQKTDTIFAKQLFVRMPAPSSRPIADEPKRKGKAQKAVWLSGSISHEDYPDEARNANAQGVTVVSIDIGIDGRISACRITESSGSKLLDDTTCSIFRDRFIFDPARSSKGVAIPETRTQRVRWQMPDTKPFEYKPFSTEISYVLGVDGSPSECKVTGATPEQLAQADPCKKLPANMPVRIGADGKPHRVKLIFRQSMVIEDLPDAPPAASPPATAPSSGNPH